MKLNVWRCIKQYTQVKTDPYKDACNSGILQNGDTTIELDCVDDSKNSMRWIKTVNGWINTKDMEMCREDFLDFPLFHFSISNIEDYLKSIEYKKSKGYSQKTYEAIIQSIIQRELIILTHLQNTIPNGYCEQTLAELERNVSMCKVVIIDGDKYNEMKKAYDQIEAMKKILEGSK